MKIFGKGFNFSQDGPGNRLVYHLSGCNMRCLWCSNPEGLDATAGEECSISQIVDECVICKPMYFSGGGVTFTGGEATLQYNELLEILIRLKKSEIHTCIETNGTSEKLPQILQYIDYFIMDFKHFDSMVLKKYTGVGNEIVKQNFERNCNSGRQQHIRIPLINGVNADCPKAFAEYFSKFNTDNTCFEFLPYHEYGKDKWETEYKITNGFISNKTLKEFIDTFEQYGLKTVTT